jgi:hypothetical protein
MGNGHSNGGYGGYGGGGRSPLWTMLSIAVPIALLVALCVLVSTTSGRDALSGSSGKSDDGDPDKDGIASVPPGNRLVRRLSNFSRLHTLYQ